MNDRIHDDEPDTSEAVVRTLLETERPEWADAPLSYLATSGTDNAMWRLRLDEGPDVVVRLPRRPGAAAGVENEAAVLRQLDALRLGAVRTPALRHQGRPHEVFPHPWMVLEWIDGTDVWSARGVLDGSSDFAVDVAATVRAISAAEIDLDRTRRAGDRGGPIAPLLDALDQWLTDPQWDADALIDVSAVRRLVDQARELVDEPVRSGVVHGDLIPGNLLVDGRRLCAVIDWGGAARGDVAQDLAPAWAVLDGRERETFREMVEVSEVEWLRGRAFELEHAVGGVLYYAPRRHPLGDVMQRTLHRILNSH